MRALFSVPEQGQLAVVRQRRYVVTDVRRGADGAQLEDDAPGEELQVNWEIEPGARAFEKMELPEPKGFDQPAHLAAFLDAVRVGRGLMAQICIAIAALTTCCPAASLEPAWAEISRFSESYA
jgi:hypothetical protein